MRPSFSQSLRTITVDPLGERLLESMNEPALEKLAQELARHDPYRERARLEAALALTGCSNECVTKAIEHQLWCAWRGLRARQGSPDFALPIEIKGAEWITATTGYPTIIISPMTMNVWDTVAAIKQGINRFSAGRSVVLYGEDLENKEMPDGMQDHLAGNGASAMRRIVSSLQAGGVFCTYPDFVFDGHAAMTIEMFGQQRPISSSFVALAAQPRTHLLPCRLERVPDGIVCHFEQPTMVVDESHSNSLEARQWFRAEVAQLIANILGQLIIKNPHQWLLLGTLTFESPQMASL